MSRRVVVVGNGMAGARLVDELCALDEDVQITVFGAEPNPPYNRILLSDVLAGRARFEHTLLGGQSDTDTRTGVSVVAIDRQRRLVHAEDGSQVRYDTLVLATGSVPLLPPIPGLSLHLPGVEVFRTIGDCRRILSSGARRAIVLGGGLLGLEAARGLAGRGIAVTVVHAAPFLMERQLDAAAGRVLARTLNKLGIRTVLDARTTQVLGTEKFRGLLLADGSQLSADLLVVACGTRPDTALAKAAGLRVDRGISVDSSMRSVTDARVYAIGECAEHDGQLHGLVGPAWEQAAVAARRISGADPTCTYTGSRPVTRLKASDIELAAMGDTDATEDEAEVLHFADPSRGTYKKLVIKDGRLAGAILLGDVSTVGTVMQLFDRGCALPPERLGLLFAGLNSATPADPAQLPDSATVCHCNSVSKGAITTCVLAGARTVADVAARTRATTGCGSCTRLVGDVVQGLHASVAAQAALRPTA